MAQSIKLAIINPKGKNEIIEFFDYNCIHCKRVAKVIDNFLKTRNDIRVVLRPIPILGQSSLYTTQIGYAILLLDIDKYLDFYNIVMDSSDGIGELIYDITDKININIEGLKTYLIGSISLPSYIFLPPAEPLFLGLFFVAISFPYINNIKNIYTI